MGLNGHNAQYIFFKPETVTGPHLICTCSRNCLSSLGGSQGGKLSSLSLEQTNRTQQGMVGCPTGPAPPGSCLQTLHAYCMASDDLMLCGGLRGDGCMVVNGFVRGSCSQLASNIRCMCKHLGWGRTGSMRQKPFHGSPALGMTVEETHQALT